MKASTTRQAHAASQIKVYGEPGRRYAVVDEWVQPAYYPGKWVEYNSVAVRDEDHFAALVALGADCGHLAAVTLLRFAQA